MRRSTMTVPDKAPLDCGDWDGCKSAALLDHMITEFCEAFDGHPTRVVMVNVPAKLIRRFPWVNHPSLMPFDRPTYIGEVRVQGSGVMSVFAGTIKDRGYGSIYMCDLDKSVVSDVEATL